MYGQSRIISAVGQCNLLIVCYTEEPGGTLGQQKGSVWMCWKVAIAVLVESCLALASQTVPNSRSCIPVSHIRACKCKRGHAHVACMRCRDRQSAHAAWECPPDKEKWQAI